MKSILATCYVGAAEESITMGGRPRTSNVLATVAEVRRAEDDTEHGHAEYYRAWERLDKAFHGALSKFNHSLSLAPGYSGACSGQAKAFQDAADDILLHEYRVWPTYMEYRRDPSQGKEGATVQHGSAILGVCFTEETPVIRFADEIIWLYERAEQHYGEALRLDPTDAESYVNLSHALRQLGKEEEAQQNLHKALAIVNKATAADAIDEISYSERAAILEEMGEVDAAIADLEQVLTLTSSEFTVDSTRQKLEALLKQDGAAPEE
ncbi:MAG: tetratricopeptide repeat protein [Chloroflexi bacterium]|nr:tetratricopeptide repeat protein [Chloroflexota bacterium]